MSSSPICLSSLRGSGLPCVFAFLMDLRIVDFSVSSAFLFVVRMEWQLPSSLYMELETKSPLNFSRSLFHWKWLCMYYIIYYIILYYIYVCTILSLLEFSIFQIILFYTVWVIVYRVLSPYLQLCKVLSLITVLSSQQPCKVDVILISQTGTISEMYTLLVRIHTTAKWQCRSERVFFSPLDLRRIINFQSTLLLLCSDLQQFLL